MAESDPKRRGSSAGMRKHRSFAGGLANGSNRREAEVPARLPSWLGLTQSALCQQPGEGCGTLSAESYALRQTPQQRLRFGDLRHFRRRRKALERRREDGLRVAREADRMVKLGDRVGRQQGVTARALPVGNSEGGLESFLGRNGVCGTPR